MKAPVRADAEALLAEAAQLNPGPWISHSKTAADCAFRIAARCPGMDPEAAYSLGLLHDIGRREGRCGLLHILYGYRFLSGLGFSDAARICLTHSFPLLELGAFQGHNDCSAEETVWLQSELSRLSISDYDRLIQLCDALASPEGPVYLEKRLVDVVLRNGFNQFTVEKWKKFLSLKSYFDELAGVDLYQSLLSETAGQKEKQMPPVPTMLKGQKCPSLPQ